jgi:hypothetical protein
MKQLLLAVTICAAMFGMSSTSFAATSCGVPTSQHHVRYVHHTAYRSIHHPAYRTVYRTVYQPVYQPTYYQSAYYGPHWHHGYWAHPYQPAVIVHSW